VPAGDGQQGMVSRWAKGLPDQTEKGNILEEILGLESTAYTHRRKTIETTAHNL